VSSKPESRYQRVEANYEEMEAEKTAVESRADVPFTIHNSTLDVHHPNLQSQSSVGPCTHLRIHLTPFTFPALVPDL